MPFICLRTRRLRTTPETVFSMLIVGAKVRSAGKQDRSIRKETKGGSADQIEPWPEGIPWVTSISLNLTMSPTNVISVSY